MPEQAAYNVTFYDLDLTILPHDSSINGSNLIKARIVQPIDYFIANLDTLLKIKRITEINGDSEERRDFRHENGKIHIKLGRTRQPDEFISLKIYYGGKPLVARRPPWSGGFTWARTMDDSPWIATSCQGEGADIWWPVKDHISDEPDSMGIHVRVPDPLICAANGRLQAVEKHDDNTSTYHWFVSTPINNYAVALNIAPYKTIEQEYKNEYGDVFPFIFWVLPEDFEKGLKIFPEFIAHMRFFEKYLGPYPFRADKYGVVQTPHLGMEHQTIIAYGANFDNGAMTGGMDWGFDALHHHELSHEWWGNLVTNADTKDMWLHEGFGTYMQALYMEELKGAPGYHEYLASNRNFGETYAVAPLESKSDNQMSGVPIYSKGAWILHTLRYLIGENLFKQSLRKMAYPREELEKVTDGSHTRFATTNDYISIIEEISSKKADWFFNVYAHQPLLPLLKTELNNDILKLNWIVPDNMPFPMPVDIKIDNEIQRVEIGNEGAVLNINPHSKIEIDPNNWVLMNPAGLKEAKTAVNNGEYEKALDLLKQLIAVYAENPLINNMFRHIKFQKRTSQKQISGIFDSYTGRYRLNANRDYLISIGDSGQYFLESRRVRNRIFPISETEFITLESNKIYQIEMHDEKNKVMIIRSKNITSKAYYITVKPDQPL